MTWRKVVWTTVMCTVWASAMVLGPGLMRAEVTLGAADLEKADTATTIPVAKAVAPANPKLVKLPFSFPAGMENTPVLYKGRPVLVQNRRSTKRDEQEQADLFIGDLATGQEVAKFGVGFSFVSAIVNGDEMNVLGTRNTNQEWTKDLVKWDKVPDLAFADLTEMSFCACPALRYCAPYCYVIYGIECEKE